MGAAYFPAEQHRDAGGVDGAAHVIGMRAAVIDSIRFYPAIRIAAAHRHAQIAEGGADALAVRLLAGRFISRQMDQCRREGEDARVFFARQIGEFS